MLEGVRRGATPSQVQVMADSKLDISELDRVTTQLWTQLRISSYVYYLSSSDAAAMLVHDIWYGYGNGTIVRIVCLKRGENALYVDQLANGFATNV